MRTMHRLAAALYFLACAACTACAEPVVARYRCSLPDGSAVIVAQDLSRAFSNAVSGCTELLLREAPPAPVEESLAPAFVDLSWKAPEGGEPSTWAAAVAPAAVLAIVWEAGVRYGLDPALLASLIYVESRYQANARSSKGALGLMQVMPATAARYGVQAPERLLEPAVNVNVGARYLRDLHDVFGGQTELVLAAYNAGEGAVARHGNWVPPFRETEDYVRRILSMYRAAGRVAAGKNHFE